LLSWKRYVSWKLNREIGTLCVQSVLEYSFGFVWENAIGVSGLLISEPLGVVTEVSAWIVIKSPLLF